MIIETGIKPPLKRNNNKSKWMETALLMREGNSVIVKNKGEANSLSYVIRYYGDDATMRKLEDGQYRVWKISREVKP